MHSYYEKEEVLIIQRRNECSVGAFCQAQAIQAIDPLIGPD